MTAAEAEAQVAAAAALQGIPLDAERLRRVAVAFARNAEIAALVVAFDLPESVEPAPQFQP